MESRQRHREAGEAQRLVLAGTENTGAAKALLKEHVVWQGEFDRWTVNLYNNNIHKNKIFQRIIKKIIFLKLIEKYLMSIMK